MSERMEIALGVLFLIALVAFPAAGADRLSFKLTGGFNYSIFGDINDAAHGELYFWRDDVVRLGGSCVDRLKPLHTSPVYVVDLIYRINSQFSLGLGVGYVRAKNRSEITLVWPSEPESTAGYYPDVRAIPLRLSVLQSVPLSQGMKLVFSAGGDIYFAQFRSSDMPGGAGNVNRQKASAVGVGLRYGVGLNIKITKLLGLVLEGEGRYAKIGGFRGTLDSAGSTLPHEEKGALYYMVFMGGPGNLTPYPMVFVQETKPSEDFYSIVRKAKADFSGFSLLAGIRIFL